MSARERQERNLRVFFIDDEAKKPRASAAGYLEALNGARVSVHLGLSAADAIRHIESNELSEDVVILDVMMDDDTTIDGHLYPKDDAGIGILRRRLRNPKYAYNHVPILILTNRDVNDKKIKSAARLPQVRAVTKEKTLPGDLPALVQGMIPRARV